MAVESKPRASQDSFRDALRAETLAGTENLSAWLTHISSRDGTESLFELEAWLRGLRAFFRAEHLPLDDRERSEIVSRSFAPEIRTARRAIQECETACSRVVGLGQPEVTQFEEFIEAQLRKDTSIDYHIGRILAQPGPLDSLAHLVEALSDLRVLTEEEAGTPRSYQAYLSLGRTFERRLAECRYIDMLLAQRFKPQFDRVDNAALSGTLRGIAEEAIRRNVALALLHLYRFLHYLQLIRRDLQADRPLRHTLVLFSLLHEEVDGLIQLLKSRFLKGRESGHRLWNAAELLVYSLRMESQRALERELVGASREGDAHALFVQIETTWGLLDNCFRNAIVTLAQAFDKNFDGKLVFPAVVDRIAEAQKLKNDLWALRQYCKEVLAKKEELDLGKIMLRMTEFRESSLRYLLYRDWEEIDRFYDAIAAAGNRIEIRTLLRKLTSFLETLVVEVSKRSVLSEHAVDSTDTP